MQSQSKPQPPNPKVIDEIYEVERPDVYCEVIVSGNVNGIDEFGSGRGFARAEHGDKFEENFGRKLARKKAIARAERDFYHSIAERVYHERMAQARDLVTEKYPIPVAEFSSFQVYSETKDEPLYASFLRAVADVGKALVKPRGVQKQHEGDE